MKKQSIVNLVKYHTEKNESAFTAEVAEIAKNFEANGETAFAQYLMELISDANFYVPQMSYHNLKYLKKIEYSTQPLFLPDAIEEDVIGVFKAINSRSGLSKFLFYGKSGTGKTESAYQIARLLERDILTVSFEQIVDSRLGETPKNVSVLFDELNHLPYSKVIVLFDEIDALVLDRVNRNDLREMGRVTSTFLKELDGLNENIVLIATTNLFNSFDPAIVRRFDATVSFDRYSKEDLIYIADSILMANLKQATNSKQDIRLFHKILRNAEQIPFPGDLKRMIKTAIAFSNESNEYDYLRRIYLALNEDRTEVNIKQLSEEGYTTREIEILSRIPKSNVSRKLKAL